MVRRMFDFKIDAAGTKRRIGRLQKRARVEMFSAVRDILWQQRNRVVKGRIKRYPGYKGALNRPRGGKIFSRTGALRESINVLGPSGLRTVRGKVVVTAPYAEIQEFGGVVKPTGGRKYLTIPLRAALTDSGGKRFTSRLVESGGRYETSDGDPTHIGRSKRGNLVVYMTRGGKRVPIYLLKTSVKIPPRLGFFDTWDRIEKYRLKRLGQAGGAMLRRGPGG